MPFFSASAGGFFHAEIVGDRMPPDAIEITDARHAELMAAQAAGQVIATDKRGRPITVDRPSPTPEALWAGLRARRNVLLAASDWSQLPDVPAAVQAAWRPYRQALRDLPAATEDPGAPAWPEPPAAAQSPASVGSSA